MATPLQRAAGEVQYGPARPRRPRATWPREDTIEKLTSKQRAFLKSRAHSLKPLHQVGREGVTDGTVQSVTESLNTRELLKVKVLEGAPANARETGAALVERIPDAQLVQVIGRTVVVYRPHPEKPEIRLP
ncbi:MAG TPA: ribosome assembly RNA-binding protein YhbY [Longimicrobiales bacterium]|nr:ribosome assembly RNA-binding protein YhbY [Longimicrobiales bacterium]